tara:strand:- start:609 stop:1064 length:456 start_codon:yes stop_codon:yes gene_type:complete
MNENKEKEISLVSKVNLMDVDNIGCAYYDLNIAVVYKTGQKFDIELVGDTFYGDSDFGMVEPPCTLLPFEYISEDILENTYGSFELAEIWNNYNSKEFLKDLEQLDHFFMYERESDVFQEIDFESFHQSFSESELVETHSLDLITYEFEGS